MVDQRGPDEGEVARIASNCPAASGVAEKLNTTNDGVRRVVTGDSVGPDMICRSNHPDVAQSDPSGFEAKPSSGRKDRFTVIGLINVQPYAVRSGWCSRWNQQAVVVLEGRSPRPITLIEKISAELLIRLRPGEPRLIDQAQGDSHSRPSGRRPLPPEGGRDGVPRREVVTIECVLGHAETVSEGNRDRILDEIGWSVETVVLKSAGHRPIVEGAVGVLSKPTGNNIARVVVSGSVQEDPGADMIGSNVSKLAGRLIDVERNVTWQRVRHPGIVDVIRIKWRLRRAVEDDRVVRADKRGGIFHVGIVGTLDVASPPDVVERTARQSYQNRKRDGASQDSHRRPARRDAEARSSQSPART